MGIVMKTLETISFATAVAWESWLETNHVSTGGVWLRIYKKASGKETITYAEALDGALCYGWIDGISKGIDAEKYAQRFSPRRKKSNWTDTNKAIARRLIAEGRMTKAGRAVLPDDV